MKCTNRAVQKESGIEERENMISKNAEGGKCTDPFLAANLQKWFLAECFRLDCITKCCGNRISGELKTKESVLTAALGVMEKFQGFRYEIGMHARKALVGHGLKGRNNAK